jgi:hypothetical protein
VTFSGDHVFQFLQRRIVGQQMDVRSIRLRRNALELILVCVLRDTDGKNFVISLPQPSRKVARIRPGIRSSVRDKEQHFVAALSRLWGHDVKDFTQRGLRVGTTALKLNVAC